MGNNNNIDEGRGMKRGIAHKKMLSEQLSVHRNGRALQVRVAVSKTFLAVVLGGDCGGGDGVVTMVVVVAVVVVSNTRGPSVRLLTIASDWTICLHSRSDVIHGRLPSRGEVEIAELSFPVNHVL